MAAHLPRTASGIASTLTSVLRPRSLVSSSQTFATSRRCLHQEPTSEAAAVVPETSETTPEVSGTAKKTYERKPERLAYKPVKKYQNVRPQPIAPYGVRVRQPYIVNDNPKMLDAMYKDLFGADEFGLENGLKWQAVTHKSFDHGRQPYNEKLALMGERLLRLHAALDIISKPITTVYATPSVYKSVEGAVYQQPEPFVSEDYKGLANVTQTRINKLLSDEVLAPIINRTGLAQKMRWKPANVKDMSMSGRMSVAADCLKAIVGAVALQHGGDAAGRFIKARILNQNLA